LRKRRPRKSNGRAVPAAGEIAWLALATAALSLTIAKTHAFDWLRSWVLARSDYLGELVSCHYCMSHWFALGLVAVYRPVVVSSGVTLFDLAVSVFALVALSALVSATIARLMRGSPEDQH
jgi:hypothetical protein